MNHEDLKTGTDYFGTVETVERTNKAPFTPDGGKTLYQFAYTIKTEKFGECKVFAWHQSEESPFAFGKDVQFSFKNLDTNTGKVSKPKTGNEGSSYGGKDLKGIKIGHAVTNGIQLAIADGDLSDTHVKERCLFVYNLSADLNKEL